VAHVGIIARKALESLGIKRHGGDGVTPRSLLLDTRHRPWTIDTR
jgi:hypothetical protein